MKRAVRFFEDKLVDIFAPGGEDQDVANKFEEDLFGRNK